MNVKEAIKDAKTQIYEIFQDEKPTDIGLEEIEYNESDETWVITIGFLRPWDISSISVAESIAGIVGNKRTYKVVRISDKNGKMLSIKNHKVQN